MISIETIISAAEDLVAGQFSSDEKYRNLTPRDFKRPSFLFEGGPVKTAPAGISLLEVTATITITIFVEVDAYHNSHIQELEQRMMSVKELFAVGYLRVGDRALHVINTDGNYQFDFATVQVTLNYLDDCPGDGKTWPLMGEVHTTIKEG